MSTETAQALYTLLCEAGYRPSLSDVDRDLAWAKYRLGDDYLTVEAEYDVTSTDESIAAELVREARLAGVQPKKEGDQKACVLCEEKAILKLIRPHDAHFVGNEGALPERPQPGLGWECSVCGYVEWLSN